MTPNKKHIEKATQAQIKTHKENVAKAIDQWRRLNPPPVQLSHAEKKHILEQRKSEINGLYYSIGKDHRAARKLIFNTIHHAKRIGDLLRDVKYRLLEHGEYETWVEANFTGGLSTARAYTRIANPKNWERIAAKLRSNMTIQAALAMLVERGPEKPKHRWQKLCERLGERLTRRAAYWPENAVYRLAWDNEIIDRFEGAARKRNKELKATEVNTR